MKRVEFLTARVLDRRASYSVRFFQSLAWGSSDLPHILLAY